MGCISTQTSKSNYIPKLDSSNQHLYEQISQKVKSIITTHDKEPLQNEIDSLVYKLYNLSNDEIQTIEKEVNM